MGDIGWSGMEGGGRMGDIGWSGMEGAGGWAT